MSGVQTFALPNWTLILIFFFKNLKTLKKTIFISRFRKEHLKSTITTPRISERKKKKKKKKQNKKKTQPTT